MMTMMMMMLGTVDYAATICYMNMYQRFGDTSMLLDHINNYQDIRTYIYNYIYISRFIYTAHPFCDCGSRQIPA